MYQLAQSPARTDELELGVSNDLFKSSKETPKPKGDFVKSSTEAPKSNTVSSNPITSTNPNDDDSSDEYIHCNLPKRDNPPDHDSDKDSTFAPPRSKSRRSRPKAKAKISQPSSFLDSQVSVVPPTPDSDTKDFMTSISAVLTQIQARLTSLEASSPFKGFDPSSPSSSKSATGRKALATAPIDVVADDAAGSDSPRFGYNVQLSSLLDIFSNNLDSSVMATQRGILTRTKHSVSFALSTVERLPLIQLSPDWRPLDPGMALGKELGSIVFKDGTRFGPESIDLDLSTYERPVWQWRRAIRTSKPPKRKIPVRQAFDDFVRALSQEPVSVSEWMGASFKPPGSNSERALVMNSDENSFVATFFAKAPKWFSEIAKKGEG